MCDPRIHPLPQLSSSPFSRNARKCRFEYMETQLCSVPIWRETGDHLLVWMNIVSKIPQPMTKFLHVWFKQTNLTGNVYKLRKAPFVKALDTAIPCFRAGRQLTVISPLQFQPRSSFTFLNSSCGRRCIPISNRQREFSSPDHGSIGVERCFQPCRLKWLTSRLSPIRQALKSGS